MLTLRTFKGLFRRFRSLILGRDVEIVGQCRLCGSCCHDILIRDDKRWIKSMRQFKKLCKNRPEHTRFKVTGHDDLGHLSFSCTLQGEDGFCTDYGSRLPLCRNYPSKSLYYQGGWLRSDCGFSFKAVTFRDAWMRRNRDKSPQFSEVLQQETERTEDT